MEIQEIQTKLRVLVASEGHRLTTDGRYFAAKVYLGAGDDGSSWREVTDGEAEEALAALAREEASAPSSAEGEEEPGDGATGKPQEG